QKNNPDGDVQDCVSRINHAADQVKGLITELVSLTSLVNDSHPKTNVDLRALVDDTVREMEPKMKQYNATVRVQQLPHTNRYETQLTILSRNLIHHTLRC